MAWAEEALCPGPSASPAGPGTSPGVPSHRAASASSTLKSLADRFFKCTTPPDLSPDLSSDLSVMAPPFSLEEDLGTCTRKETGAPTVTSRAVTGARRVGLEEEEEEEEVLNACKVISWREARKC